MRIVIDDGVNNSLPSAHGCQDIDLRHLCDVLFKRLVPYAKDDFHSHTLCNPFFERCDVSDNAGRDGLIRLVLLGGKDEQERLPRNTGGIDQA